MVIFQVLKSFESVKTLFSPVQHDLIFHIWLTAISWGISYETDKFFLKLPGVCLRIEKGALDRNSQKPEEIFTILCSRRKYIYLVDFSLCDLAFQSRYLLHLSPFNYYLHDSSHTTSRRMKEMIDQQ